MRSLTSLHESRAYSLQNFGPAVRLLQQYLPQADIRPDSCATFPSHITAAFRSLSPRLRAIPVLASLMGIVNFCLNVVLTQYPRSLRRELQLPSDRLCDLLASTTYSLSASISKWRDKRI